MRFSHKFRLYDSKKNHRLDDIIDLAGRAYNHEIALRRRWWRLFGKKNAEYNKTLKESCGMKLTKDEEKELKSKLKPVHISTYTMQKHIAKLKGYRKEDKAKWAPCVKKDPRKKHFGWMNDIPSQALQNISERIAEGYRLFFDSVKERKGRKVRLPSFKKVDNYKSYTLKAAGWKLLAKGLIDIGGVLYRFIESRPITGEIKTVTIKRDKCGHYYLCFSCEVDIVFPMDRYMTGKIAGLDAGVSTFLTLAEYDALTGKETVRKLDAPLYYKHALRHLATLGRNFSRRLVAYEKLVDEAARKWEKDGRKGQKPVVPHSNRFYYAYDGLVKFHKHISDSRADWQWKLAKELATAYDIIYIEDLNFRGWQRNWGRKVSDLAPGEFFATLEFACKKYGCALVRHKWNFPSTQTCHSCGHRLRGENKLGPKDREWTCPKCGVHHDRDENAAINILRG